MRVLNAATNEITRSHNYLMFIPRKISNGIGVERIFPIHSPHVKSVDVLRKGKVRRAKLYYIRNRVGKAAKVKEKL